MMVLMMVWTVMAASYRCHFHCFGMNVSWMTLNRLSPHPYLAACVAAFHRSQLNLMMLWMMMNRMRMTNCRHLKRHRHRPPRFDLTMKMMTTQLKQRLTKMTQIQMMPVQMMEIVAMTMTMTMKQTTRRRKSSHLCAVVASVA